MGIKNCDKKSCKTRFILIVQTKVLQYKSIAEQGQGWRKGSEKVLISELGHKID